MCVYLLRQFGVWNGRASCKFGQSVDWDGLPSYVDPVQQRITQLVTEYDQQIRQLSIQLSHTRACLQKATLNGGQLINDARDEQVTHENLLDVHLNMQHKFSLSH